MELDSQPVSFGEWVKQRRKSLDLTQEELSQRVGFSVFALRKIESGERRPSKQFASLLSRALDIKTELQPTFLRVARGELNIERLGSSSPGSISESRPASAPIRLPAPPTPLVGREQELSVLSRFLRDPKCRLLTLVGPGGIGKTRLALEVASQNQDFFSDQVCFVSLASLNAPGFLVPAIADGLGFTFHGQTEPRLQLLNYLRTKNILLWLDNVEHLVENTGLFAEIIERAPGVKLLATSRERLNMRGEWVFEIQGLPVPPADGQDDLEEFSSVALFLQSARRLKAGFEIRGNDQEAVIRICQVLEGMPLGIELAAAWVSVLSCSEIAQEIEQSLDFLKSSMRNVPARQRSLSAAFEHSWRLLSQEEQAVLCQLSIFRGGFVRKAAEKVTGATLSGIQSLVSKSLVRYKESGRFDLHEVIRQYASSHLAHDPQCELAHDRHSDFYLTLVCDREADMSGAAQVDAIRELTNEIDNIRTAWARAIQTERFPLISRALRSLGWYYEVGGWLQDGIDQIELAVQACRAQPGDEQRQKTLGQALSQQGMLFFRLGQFQRAVEHFEESLALLRPFGDPALLVHPLVWLGVIVHLNGDLEQAVALINEGLGCSIAAGDRWLEAYSHFNLGYVDSIAGRYRQGYEKMDTGLRIWRELGDPAAIALGLNHISLTAIHLGRLEDARQFLLESLDLTAQVGDRWGMGTAYRSLGRTALAQGNPVEAQTLIRKSLELFAGITAGWDFARSHIFLAEAEAAEGDLERARQTYLVALREAVEARSEPLIADALIGLACLQAEAGKAREALELALCVLDQPASTHETRERAVCLSDELLRQQPDQSVDSALGEIKKVPLAEILERLLRC